MGGKRRVNADSIVVGSTTYQLDKPGMYRALNKVYREATGKTDMPKTIDMMTALKRTKYLEAIWSDSLVGVSELTPCDEREEIRKRLRAWLHKPDNQVDMDEIMNDPDHKEHERPRKRILATYDAKLSFEEMVNQLKKSMLSMTETEGNSIAFELNMNPVWDGFDRPHVYADALVRQGGEVSFFPLEREAAKKHRLRALFDLPEVESGKTNKVDMCSMMPRLAIYFSFTNQNFTLELLKQGELKRANVDKQYALAQRQFIQLRALLHGMTNVDLFRYISEDGELCVDVVESGEERALKLQEREGFVISGEETMRRVEALCEWDISRRIEIVYDVSRHCWHLLCKV